MRAGYSRRLTVASVAAVVMVALTVPAVAAGAPPQGQNVEAIVLLDHSPGAADEVRVTGLGGRVGKRLENINVLIVSLPEPALAALSRSPGVLSVERARDDIFYHDHATDPGDELQWGVNRVDAEIAHADTKTGSGVVVAVVDTGIDLDHPEFVGRIDSRRMSFAGGRPSDDVSDKNGHGTHTAGIVGAAADGIGVVGVAPEATILPIQVSKGNNIKDAAVLAAFDYLLGLEQVVDGSVDVVSMSFGSSQSSDAEEAALQALAVEGVTLVASAGNDSGGQLGFPAGYDHVMAVSSTNLDDTLSSFSSVGLRLGDVAAPGSNIYSTSKDGGYVHKSGTSMSAPHVAGAAALVIETGLPDARGVLTGAAEDIGLTTSQRGAGLLDVAAAFGLNSGNNLGNVPPVVDAGPDQSVVLDATVQLDGSVTDANGDVLAIAWTVTDQPAGSTASPVDASNPQTTFTPDLAGSYTLQLTATESSTNELYGTSDSVVINALASGTEIESYGVASITVVRTRQGRWENVDFTVTIKTSAGLAVEDAAVTASISRPGRVFDDLVGTTNASGQTRFRIKRAINEIYSILIKDVTHTDPVLAWNGAQASASEGADYPS